ncbi:MAG: NIL domain-containing protein [Armatimonadetes bacterium]|nr:NIL domain-containing protein [Armatimonadota bacterium]MCX7968572.1 NIL domain-containing protein [Armatimonadota bacterium]MDW8142590.1 NIL domain-containing protein [Armatimonadota bacterium]
MANTKQRVQLVYPKHLVDKPILWELAQRFKVITNIRRANVDAECGWIDLELEGEEEEMERAISWLRQVGVEVNPVERQVIE